MSQPERQALASAPWEAAPPGRTPSRALASEIIAGWAQGVPVDARAALAEYPELAANKDIVLDLAYEEYCRHKDAGAPPDLDEFCERFPSFRASLRRLIEAHRFLEESSLLPTPGAAVSWPQTGEVFLGFSLRSPLGRGAFAQVFLATEAELGHRAVALKISRHGAAEAATLGRLRHENIVPVYSVHHDPDTGLTAVVMPYLGSATLCDVLDRAFAGGARPSRARVILEAARAALPAEDVTPDRHPPHPLLERGTYVDGAVLLAAQLAEALALTHRRGILHRDLKPSNILLTPDGVPMLLDFNLSFDEQGADQRLGGTLPYMAPEHLRATDPDAGLDPSQVDARSDLFSLGVILFELLTGTHPFGPIPAHLSIVQVREYLGRRQKAGPHSLCRANPQVDRSLARLLERCLAFDPKDRPQSAKALATALRARLSQRHRGWRWVARHARLVVGGLFLALVVGTTAGVLSAWRDPPYLAPMTAGLEAYDHQQYEEALEHFNRACEAAPGNPWLVFARGRVSLRQATLAWIQGGEKPRDLFPKFQKALVDFQEAERSIPDGRVDFCIGLCYSFQGNNPKAIEAYRKALTAGFQRAEVFNNLAYCLWARRGPARPPEPDDLEEALRLLNRAIAEQPDLGAAPYHNRAWVRFALLRRRALKQRPEKAALEDMMADIRRARELTPTGPGAVEFYVDAACVSALAARYEARWDDLALDFARQAIAHGCDPGLLKKNLSQNSRKSGLFETLPNANPPYNRTRILRLLDPIAGIPQDLWVQP